MFAHGFGPANVNNPPVTPRTPSRWQCRGKPALVLLVMTVALALLGGGVAAYGLLHVSATVTITPRSSNLKQTFTLTGVLGTPDASKMQVGARMVSVMTQSQTKTVPATGQQTTPGTHASGTLYVENDDTANALILPAGSTFPNMGCALSSLLIVLDARVSLPPSSSTTVPGHVNQVGASGNFPASCGDTAAFYYSSNTLSITNNSAFTGGTDPQTVTAVTQSDIDGAANSLIQANQPNARQVIGGQLQPNEQLADKPQCSPTSSADHQAGDQASQVAVSVTFTCTGEAYDHAGALALAAALLKSQAANTPGAGYALVGQLKTTLLSATPDTQGAVQILAQAEGIWVFQFSAAQKQALAKLIVGKGQQEAQRLLATQPGVAQASITLSGGIGQTLPADAAKITLVVQTISGF